MNNIRTGIRNKISDHHHQINVSIDSAVSDDVFTVYIAIYGNGGVDYELRNFSHFLGEVTLKITL